MIAKFFRSLIFIIFLVSIFTIGATYGTVAGYFKLFPHSQISMVLNHFKNKAVNEAHPSYLFKSLYNKSSVITHDKDKTSTGLVLISSYMPINNEWMPGIKLINNYGDTVFDWTKQNTPFFEQFQQSQTYVHGSYVYPNGDIILNFEYSKLAKMNSCGEVIWQIDDYKTHHSVYKDSEGNFWIPALEDVKPKNNQRYIKNHPGIKKPFTHETVLKISPEGKVLKKISLMDAFYRNKESRALLWKYKKTRQHHGDIFHLNDVEILEPSMSEAYNHFSAGDLLVSLKYISTVAVLDQQGSIKWLSEGDFLEQHDADFEGDGNITVFNNNLDYSKNGEYLGGTKIQAINPNNNFIKDIYPPPLSENTTRFYSPEGGKHQLLSNGNRLLTEAQTGRVIEISNEGKIVWEWLNHRYDILDAVYVPEVLEASRYMQLSNDDIKQWACYNTKH